tara:strand:- start:1258 stop:1992 length:735 start_codon:yes stop_codon:yes gene_type:complete
MMTVDINCDVGEGINNEELLMPYISSCNIACGAHAGDLETIDRVIKIARKNNVKIGAHPSFPDRKNFGRVIMVISLEELEISLINQINLIKERLDLLGGTLHHVKAHGALYNLSAVNKETAEVIVSSIKKVAPDAILYVPNNSIIEKVAIKNKLHTKLEAFADRNYNDDLTLVSRSQKNAVITNKDEVMNHISQMIFHQQVKTIFNNLIAIKPETFCIHGDNTEAIELVKYIHQSLTEKGIHIA